MVHLDGIKAATGSCHVSRRRSPPNDADASAPQAGRALVAVQPIEGSEHAESPRHRPAAPFLAQLIAATQGAPQTRHRRRAAPAEAARSYEAAAAAYLRRHLSRTM
jgi:hypothetical protein